MLTALDYVIVAVVGISAILSIMRGFVREAASILSWIAAFVVAGRFYGLAASYLTFSDDELTRNILAIIILFMGTLLLVGTVSNLICTLVKKAGLSGFDRMLGIVFGVLRGVLIASAVLALMQILFRLHILTFIMDKPWWQGSVFIPELQRIVNWFFLYMGTPVSGA